MMKCPKCKSTNINCYSNDRVDCDDCGHSGRADTFDAKCTCEQPHYLPVWYCAVHGEVVVPMD